MGRTKFSKKTNPRNFLGYSPMHKGYRCLNPTIYLVYLSGHGVFDEHTFPYAPNNTPLQVDLGVTTFPNTDAWVQKGKTSIPTPTNNQGNNESQMQEGINTVLSSISDDFCKPKAQSQILAEIQTAPNSHDRN